METITTSGAFENTTISGGTTVVDLNAAKVDQDTISSGGTLIAGGANAEIQQDLVYGKVIVSGAVKQVENMTVYAGGVLSFTSNFSYNNNFNDLTLSGGNVIDDSSAATSGGQLFGGNKITYTADGGAIDLTYINYTDASIIQSGDKATITAGGTTFVMQVNSDSPVQIGNDGSGHLLIWCFLAGTPILTPSGQVLVEDLREDDLVLTASGAAKPIRWIGYRHVVAAELPDADLYAPVVIEKNAIAEGKPARDLWVTPDHAIFVAGKLIPVKLLVNGSTIRQEPRTRYSFYHIELDQHDLLLAAGLEVESYLDVAGSRQRFENNPVTALDHGVTLTELTEQTYAKYGCHPISLSAEAVQPVWQLLADRAETAGAGRAVQWNQDADLHLIVAGVPVRPVSVDGGAHAFLLPITASEITIASRAASPWQRKPWIDDRRMLGVAIREVICANARGFRSLSLEDVPPNSGWHALEGQAGSSFRWTNGAAKLNLPPGPCLVILHVTTFGEYPLVMDPVRAPELLPRCANA